MAEIVADHLVRTHAIELRPRDFFTFDSGFATPAYCDLRLALGDFKARRAIVEALAVAVRSRFLDGSTEAEGSAPVTLVGVATGGIAYATGVADLLGLPLAYVRPAAKDHGKGRRVEGGLPVAARCVVIDDVLGSGAAAASAVAALKDYGADVLGVCAVFSYDFDTLVASAAQASVPFVRLVDFMAVVERAHVWAAINADDINVIGAWYRPKSTWRSI
jgi:orotate phosphoribosyltransferase